MEYKDKYRFSSIVNIFHVYLSGVNLHYKHNKMLNTDNPLYSSNVLYHQIGMVLSLSSQSISLYDLSSKSNALAVNYKDILGATFTNSSEMPYLTLYTYFHNNSSTRIFQKHLIHSPNYYEIARFIQSMTFLSRPPHPSEAFYKRRQLIFINPFSGKGQALQSWEYIQEMFECCTIEVILTTHRNHAKEYIQDMDITSVDSIAVMSGDGLMHEVFNGLTSRPDKDLASKLPVVIIPGGSSNAMAFYLCEKSKETFNLQNCAYIAIRGKPTDLDAMCIERFNKEPVYSFMSICWGIIADIDIESEVLRFCGTMRFNIFALWRVLKLKRYQGSLVMHSEQGDTVIQTDFVSFICLNIPYLGASLHTAPKADLNDGLNHLLIIPGTASRKNIAYSLLNINEGDRYINNDSVSYYRSKDWSLIPNEPRGRFSIDGENYEPEAIRVRVLEGYFRTLIL